MNPEQMKARTKEFALRVIKLVRSIPKTIEGCAIANQIVRSGMSVAANYRASCPSRSRAEFVAKVGTVLEEADETLLWLELIGDAKFYRASVSNHGGSKPTSSSHYGCLTKICSFESEI
jgi:four helix bundle protein